MIKNLEVYPYHLLHTANDSKSIKSIFEDTKLVISNNTKSYKEDKSGEFLSTFDLDNFESLCYPGIYFTIKNISDPRIILLDSPDNIIEFSNIPFDTIWPGILSFIFPIETVNDYKLNIADSWESGYGKIESMEVLIKKGGLDFNHEVMVKTNSISLSECIGYIIHFRQAEMKFINNNINKYTTFKDLCSLYTTNKEEEFIKKSSLLAYIMYSKNDNMNKIVIMTKWV